MDEQILTELMRFVEEVSPSVWRMAQREVTASIITNVVWGTFFLAFAVAVVVFTMQRRNSGEFDAEKGIVLSFVTLVLGVFAAILFTAAIRMFVNPDFHAIQKILGFAH